MATPRRSSSSPITSGGSRRTTSGPALTSSSPASCARATIPAASSTSIPQIIPTPRPSDGEAVPNGIAYDEATGRLFVTGKLWPQLFEITIAGLGGAAAMACRRRS